MTTSFDPGDLSPAERTRAIAALLAVGLLRLSRPLATAPANPKTLSKTSRNELALAPERSVTVHTG